LSHRFFPNHRVTIQEISLVPTALIQLLIARVKVSFLRADQYLPKTQQKKELPPSLPSIKTVQQIAEVVNGVSVRTPWASTCLVKVLAAHKMLLKKNIPHILHFGLQKITPGQMKAHAWLSVSNKIIIGGEESHTYKEISRITIS
jgi:hypothetical protein